MCVCLALVFPVSPLPANLLFGTVRGRIMQSDFKAQKRFPGRLPWTEHVL